MDDKPHYKWKTIRHSSELKKAEEESETFFGYVPNYPPPLIDTNPFNLIEGNENKTY